MGERWGGRQLEAWLEENVPEALTVLSIPASRRRLRTTNGLERLNKEIKRRTRVATLFPNEASLLRLSSAVLYEISDDWETERAYLNMEARCPTPENRDLQKGCCFIEPYTFVSRKNLISFRDGEGYDFDTGAVDESTKIS